MTIIEFLQWTGVGGVALLSVYFGQRNRVKSDEHGLIEKMKQQLDSRDVQYDKLVERLDKLEESNMTLREENLKIAHERNQLSISKQNMEKELVDKIEVLAKENEALKRRIRELEEEYIK